MLDGRKTSNSQTTDTNGRLEFSFYHARFRSKDSLTLRVKKANSYQETLADSRSIYRQGPLFCNNKDAKKIAHCMELVLKI